MTGMRILIIGGTGLISNSITAQLVAAGHRVEHVNRSRMPGLVGKVPVFCVDRTDLAAFASRLSGAGTWDAVIDMICYTPDNARQLIDTFQGRAGHLIMASTIDVYAKPASRYPIREDEPHRPLNDYARNKSACERMLFDAASSGIPVTVIRPAHTYGPGSVHRGHIVHTFGGRSFAADRIAKCKSIIVHGDGSSFWTSGYSADVAAVFVAAVCNPKAFGKAYNAMSDEWLTWNRYFEIVAEAMNAPPPALVHIPSDILVRALPVRARILAENFRFNNIFDTSAIASDLNVRCATPLLEGMRRTIEWVRSGPGFEDSTAESWYDELISAWSADAQGFTQTVSHLDIAG